MLKLNKTIKGKSKLATVIASVLLCTSAFAFEAGDFECNIFSRSFIDSSRCDYYETLYRTDSTKTEIEKKQYDKSFLGTCTNLDFKLKADVSERSFIDFSENLYWRHYNEEEPLNVGYDAYKYSELNHTFNIKWGLVAGDSDFFELNYYNSALELDRFDSLNNHSNKGVAIFRHNVEDKSCFTIKGNFEDRVYKNDPVLSYKEMGTEVSFCSRVNRKDEYIQIANSTVGDKEYFKTLPGLKPIKAIEHYTNYDINPNDSDPNAKYRRRTEVGEIIYKVFGAAYSGEYVNQNNEYIQAKAGIEFSLEAAEDVTLRLNETYSKTEYDRESMMNWLYNNNSNKVSLSVDYDLTDIAAQTLTYSNETVNYSNVDAKSYKVNSLTYDGYCSFGKSTASVVIGAARRRYDDPALFYPDENETRFNATYDYRITESIKFKLKGEVIKSEYVNFENELYSNYHRRIFRTGIEKSFSPYTLLELAYQQNTERHDTYTQNNVDEHIVGLNLIFNL